MTNDSVMKLSDFDYPLPEHLIATKPLENRSSSRLLHLSDTGIVDRDFEDITEFLSPGDCLVFNNTKVIPARIFGKCNDSDVEVTLLKRCNNYKGQEVWEVLARPAKKLKKARRIIFSVDFHADYIEECGEGILALSFSKTGQEFYNHLEQAGEMPLPPYIAKRRSADESDKNTYQTVFAQKKGAVAAPTAGLHFTEEILQKMRDKNVNFVEVTLHVGGGTFLPVRTENVSEHKMHSEYYELDEKAANMINTTRNKGGRIIAVGTTSVRTLESCANEEGVISAQNGETDIFITPGYKFKVVDCMLTNFHLPKSTLMMLVSAFCGRDRIIEAYSHAIESNYRFFSYGDACFLEKMT
jgi:S-adenosylmethionine:tRNA ribosyltransferase-isomerase